MGASNYICIKCGGKPSPDCDPDEPMCQAHISYCEKCGVRGMAPDTDPPMCTDCMANAGGGNDPETKKEE